MLRFLEIRDVSLHGAGFDDDAIGTLRELPNLESFNLVHTSEIGEALASLPGHTKLIRLSISSERRVVDRRELSALPSSA